MNRELSLHREVPGFQCPPSFWAALGYTGDAPYVGLYWEQATDRPRWRDGRETRTTAVPDAPPAPPANTDAYLCLLAANFPPGHAAHWLTGTRRTPAAMWLVVERETGRAWLIPADDAEALLAEPGAAEDTAADGLGYLTFEETGNPLCGARAEPSLYPRADNQFETSSETGP